MSTRRKWLLLAAGLVLLLLLLAGLLARARIGDRGPLVLQSASAEPASKAPAPPTPPSAAPWPFALAGPPPTDAGVIPASLAEDLDLVPRRVGKMFDGDCQFGVEAHCAEWDALAKRCDTGDAEVCAKLGDLLIGEAPAQPLWGAMFLERACRLGRDEACERGSRWSRWSRYGYDPEAPDDGPPEDLIAACDRGDQVACGLIEMRAARSGTSEPNPDRALASCRWGFRDVCGIVFTSTRDTARALAALEAGCETPDAWMCWFLGLVYSEHCPGGDDLYPAPCPPRDPAAAKHYMDLACKLMPAMYQCQTR